MVSPDRHHFNVVRSGAITATVWDTLLKIVEWDRHRQPQWSSKSTLTCVRSRDTVSSKSSQGIRTIFNTQKLRRLITIHVRRKWFLWMRSRSDQGMETVHQCQHQSLRQHLASDRLLVVNITSWTVKSASTRLTTHCHRHIIARPWWQSAKIVARNNQSWAVFEILVFEIRIWNTSSI